jgi:DNA-binding NarL/FixJ family response regulator
MGKPARLAIVDDHPVVRSGLRAYLALFGDLEVVAEAGSTEEALAAVCAHSPDLVLLDLRLPDGDGLHLLATLKRAAPGARVLILTSFLDEDDLRAALRLGASGYLLKRAGQGALVDGIRAALRGERPLDPAAAKLLANLQADPLERLTPRERVVLGLLAEGLSNKAIAARLGVAEKTVKTHVSSVLGKLGCRDRVQAALYARSRRLHAAGALP